jgi:aromatic ring-cleaving dioxygenase
LTNLNLIRPEAVEGILVHPLTDHLLVDHTSRAVWIGKQLPLNTDLVANAERNMKAQGKGELDLILFEIAH